MIIIIAAVFVGLLLLWGGIAGLFRVVELFERKHFLLLGGYATLVAGAVMGIVLFTSYQRQLEHRKELQDQMNEFSKRLTDLSARLVSQLEEKANLTASEFEIRAQLQNEREQHARTRDELTAQNNRNGDLERKLEADRQSRLRYQEETNNRLEERFRQEDQRYREFSEVHRSQLQNAQKQLATMQDNLTKLNATASAMQNAQNTLLGKVNNAREVQDLTTQKLDALARNQAALYDDFNKTQAQVDSLYTWRKK